MKEIFRPRRRAISLDGDGDSRKFFAYAEFSIVTVISFIMGLALFLLMDLAETNHALPIVSRYFSAPFKDCDDFFEYVSVAIKASFGDFFQLLIVFLFAFSSVFPTLAGLIFLYRGFVLGYSTSYIGCLIIKSNSGLVPMFIIDFTTKVLVSCIAIWMAATLYKILTLSSRNGKNLRLVLANTSIFGISLGSVLLFNTFFYLMLELFIK